MTTLTRLAAQIIGWANDRNLIEGSTARKQFVKLVEEHGEYAAGLARGKTDVMADALGDKMVISIIMCQQLKVNLSAEFGRLTCDDHTADLDAGVQGLRRNLVTAMIGTEEAFFQATRTIGALGSAFGDKDLEKIKLRSVLCFGDAVAQCFEQGLNPAKVLEDVWNIIKDRKGRMVDGVFVKENDAMMQGQGNNRPLAGS